MNGFKVERGYVVLHARKKVKNRPKVWNVEVGGLDEENRFDLPIDFETPGQALDAAYEWAKQRRMQVISNGTRFKVIGDDIKVNGKE